MIELVARYPYLAPRIQSRWWRRPTDRELLAALVTWRAQLDLDHADTETPPEQQARAEWDYHRRLHDIADHLLHHGRSSGHGAFQEEADRAEFDLYLNNTLTSKEASNG